VDEARLTLERARQDSLGRVRAAEAQAQQARQDSVQRARLAEAQRQREDSIARARTAAARPDPPARPVPNVPSNAPPRTAAGSPASGPPPPSAAAVERARQDSLAALARAREAAAPARPGPGAGEASPPVAPAPSRAPAVAGLSLTGHELDERARSLAVSARFTLSGPPGTSWCVAARYFVENGAPLADRDGASAVGGRVAALAEVSASSESQAVDQRLLLPVAQLDNDLDRTAWATARLTARVALWAKSCSAVGEGERPLAETGPSTEVCLARYPAGVARCR
jgi:hypothetical protein